MDLHKQEQAFILKEHCCI